MTSPPLQIGTSSTMTLGAKGARAPLSSPCLANAGHRLPDAVNQRTSLRFTESRRGIRITDGRLNETVLRWRTVAPRGAAATPQLRATHTASSPPLSHQQLGEQ